MKTNNAITVTANIAAREKSPVGKNDLRNQTYYPYTT